MFDASLSVIEALMSGKRQYVTLTVTESDGTTSHTLTEANIVKGGFSIDNYCATGSRFEVGTAVAAQLSLKLFNADGDLDSINFKGAKIEVYIRVYTSQYEQQGFWAGIYNVDTVVTNQSSIDITAFDNMLLFDKQVGESYEDFYLSRGDLTFYATGLTVTQGTFGWLFAWICSDCGVSIDAVMFDSDMLEYFSQTFIDTKITDIPNMANLTYRALLMNICSLAVSIAIMSGRGNLKINTFDRQSSPALVFESSQIFSSDVDNESKQECLGICYTTAAGTEIALRPETYSDDSASGYINCDRSVIAYEDDDSTQADYDNPDHGNLRWWQYKRAIRSSYVPFNAITMPAPYLQPGDLINIPSMANTSDVGHISHITYVLNG
ncbi:MAG: hypothetical protein IJ740_18985, partial [Ruminococcus sp.]|nr:hypothetical protein [Ruminococcus sp.]